MLRSQIRRRYARGEGSLGDLSKAAGKEMRCRPMEVRQECVDRLTIRNHNVFSGRPNQSPGAHWDSIMDTFMRGMCCGYLAQTTEINGIKNNAHPRAGIDPRAGPRRLLPRRRRDSTCTWGTVSRTSVKPRKWSIKRSTGPRLGTVCGIREK